MSQANAHARSARTVAVDAARTDGRAEAAGRWVTPSIEVISLSCEISAYAPDEDGFPPF